MRTIEFATMEELEETGATFLKDTGYGFLGAIEDEVSSPQPQRRNKDFIIYTEFRLKYLYVSESGVTYDMNLAKRFTQDQAEEKARCMRLNGDLNWTAIKI